MADQNVTVGAKWQDDASAASGRTSKLIQNNLMQIAKGAGAALLSFHALRSGIRSLDQTARSIESIAPRMEEMDRATKGAKQEFVLLIDAMLKTQNIDPFKEATSGAKGFAGWLAALRKHIEFMNFQLANFGGITVPVPGVLNPNPQKPFMRGPPDDEASIREMGRLGDERTTAQDELTRALDELTREIQFTREREPEAVLGPGMETPVRRRTPGLIWRMPDRDMEGEIADAERQRARDREKNMQEEERFRAEIDASQQRFFDAMTFGFASAIIDGQNFFTSLRDGFRNLLAEILSATIQEGIGSFISEVFDKAPAVTVDTQARAMLPATARAQARGQFRGR